MIVKAEKIDIPEILALTRACAKSMIEKGIYQWNEHYPSASAFEQDIEREELVVLKKDGAIIGTIVVSIIMDKEYKDVEWLTPSQGNIYVHRLAVHPDMQGKGYATKLMNYALFSAQFGGAPSIRLDTFSQNKRNQQFYESRGYKRLGNIYFPKQSNDPFYCYERII
ncbi:MAG: GNAT family N-acetyltransferase [Dokdonia donghaensis]|jgi:ribosomal protein S18 acetylase RimI-like enzyme|nr:GNAT family N-acetyltransferase [Dokdonia donghaensis]